MLRDWDKVVGPGRERRVDDVGRSVGVAGSVGRVRRGAACQHEERDQRGARGAEGEAELWAGLLVRAVGVGAGAVWWAVARVFAEEGDGDRGDEFERKRDVRGKVGDLRGGVGETGCETGQGGLRGSHSGASVACERSEVKSAFPRGGREHTAPNPQSASGVLARWALSLRVVSHYLSKVRSGGALSTPARAVTGRGARGSCLVIAPPRSFVSPNYMPKLRSARGCDCAEWSVGRRRGGVATGHAQCVIYAVARLLGPLGTARLMCGTPPAPSI